MTNHEVQVAEQRWLSSWETDAIFLSVFEEVDTGKCDDTCYIREVDFDNSISCYIYIIGWIESEEKWLYTRVRISK